MGETGFGARLLCGAPGYDLEYGWGIMDGGKLADSVHDDENTSGPTPQMEDETFQTPIPADSGLGNNFIRLSRDSVWSDRRVTSIFSLSLTTTKIFIAVTEFDCVDRWSVSRSKHSLDRLRYKLQRSIGYVREIRYGTLDLPSEYVFAEVGDFVSAPRWLAPKRASLRACRFFGPCSRDIEHLAMSTENTNAQMRTGA